MSATTNGFALLFYFFNKRDTYFYQRDGYLSRCEAGKKLYEASMLSERNRARRTTSSAGATVFEGTVKPVLTQR